MNHVSRSLLCFAIILLLSTSAAIACNQCNCLMNINPFYTRQNQVGVNALFQRSHGLPSNAGHGHSHSDDAADESRYSMEFSYQHHLGANFLLGARLPYYFINSEQITNGLGDIALTASYVWNTSLSETLPFTLLFGAGVKAPTGKYSTPTEDLDAHTQFMGTGAWDGILSTQAFLQDNSWTFSADGYLQLSTTNADGLKVGNWGAFSLNAAKEISSPEEDDVTLLFLMGARLESMAANSLNSVEIEGTGHTTLFANAGLQAVLLKNLRVTVTALVPAASSIPDGGHDESARFSGGLQFLF